MRRPVARASTLQAPQQRGRKVTRRRFSPASSTLRSCAMVLDSFDKLAVDRCSRAEARRVIGELVVNLLEAQKQEYPV